MSWRVRIGLIATGVFFIIVAMLQMRAGHYVFVSMGYHQTAFAASGIGAGIVLILLAFAPKGEWLYGRISTHRDVWREGKRSSRGRRVR